MYDSCDLFLKKVNLQSKKVMERNTFCDVCLCGMWCVYLVWFAYMVFACVWCRYVHPMHSRCPITLQCFPLET